MSYQLFISCPKGMEYILSDEMKSLGLSVTKTTPMGVYGEAANLAILYHLCLWSRVANRIQLILFNGNAHNEQTMYQLCHQFHWQTVFTPDKTLAIEFHGKSRFIRNTMYGAQLIKDAIVDYFSKSGARPNVDKTSPNIRLHAYLKHDELTVSLDLTGYSLHQRGYREKAGLAPLKENVAAALLMRAGWPTLSQQGLTLVDPFCGSGTIIIEAALMAAQIAPGLLREDQALQHWAQHKPSLWDKVRTLAKQQQKPLQNRLVGYDSNPKVLKIAKLCAKNAGLTGIEFKHQTIDDYSAIEGKGLIVTNPPYGERLDDTPHLIPVYQSLGKALSQQQNWQAFVLTSSPMLAKAIGLRAHKQYGFYNGPIEAKLYCFKLDKTNQLRFDEEKSLNASALTLYNRLLKNKKHLDKWLKREKHACYRLYDADIPEYAFAVDIYDDWAHVQEYAAPKTVASHKVQQRVLDMMQVLPRVLEIPPSHLILKQRQRQRGLKQYQSFDNKKKSIIVNEGRAKFEINLHDYLDTGLFLDYRSLRLDFANFMQGKSFLNCFCYTAAFSVQAALAGAKTVNIDMSNTYLKWAERNFKLNELNINQHQFIQADCLEWLKKCNQKFDVIWLDPPSFSNSKRMKTTLDIQRDHVPLIESAMHCLNPEGKLYFSTNLRKFKMSGLLEEKYAIENITHKTIDEDFKRSKLPHQCFILQRKLTASD